MIRMLTQSTSVYIKKKMYLISRSHEIFLYLFFIYSRKRKGRTLSHLLSPFEFDPQVRPYKTLTHQTMKIVSVLHIDK